MNESSTEPIDMSLVSDVSMGLQKETSDMKCVKCKDTKMTFRSNHRRCSVKELVLRSFAKFTGKHLCQRLFFNKVAGLRMNLWHSCFPVNFAKFLRTPFSLNTSGRLVLQLTKRRNLIDLNFNVIESSQCENSSILLVKIRYILLTLGIF